MIGLPITFIIKKFNYEDDKLEKYSGEIIENLNQSSKLSAIYHSLFILRRIATIILIFGFEGNYTS